MNVYSVLSFIAFVIYFGLGIYILGHNPRSRVNRTFFYFAFAIALWSYAYIFFYSTPEKESVFYWDRVASVGWCLFPALMLLFYFRLTKKVNIITRVIPLLFFLTGILFVYRSFTTKLLTNDWYFNGYVWIPLEENAGSPWYWGFNIYMILAFLLSILLIIDWRRKEKTKRVKIQSLIFLITLGISLVGGYVTNFIFPLFKIADIPNLAHIISLAWVGGVAYSIVKYQLMVLTPKVAANEIILSMNELLFFVDTRGNIISINRFTEEMLGYSNYEVGEKPFHTFFADNKMVSELITFKANDKETNKYEVLLKPKTGKPIPVNISVSSVVDNAGEVIGTVIVGHDIRQTKQLEKEISERKQAQEELNKTNEDLDDRVKQRTFDLTVTNVALQHEITEHKKAREELVKAKQKAEESDQLKTSFLANMSHEIRTPLNGMLGFAELLKDETLSVVEKNEYIEIIRNCGEHLLELINDIIDISKIEAGQLAVNKTECNINKLLNDIYASFDTLVKTKINKEVKMTLRLSLRDEESILITDELRLRQVLTNLIGNSTKFTEKGSIEFGYTLTGNGFIEFFVKDTGIGIPKDKLDIIFKRFVQIDNSSTKKFGGTGLGLTISKELVELMGGRIWAESEQGNGSAFYFTLPYIGPACGDLP